MFAPLRLERFQSISCFSIIYGHVHQQETLMMVAGSRTVIHKGDFVVIDGWGDPKEVIDAGTLERDWAKKTPYIN